MCYNPKKINENFDKDMIEFLPVGQTRYGLIGDNLGTQLVKDCYYDKRRCYYNSIDQITPFSRKNGTK
jgi:hypothetical protein